MKKAFKNILYFYAILIGVSYAPVVLLLNSMARGTTILAPLQFFTSDTFYYLTIARHSVGKSFYTADGLFPTNGFHPLWGFLLKTVFGLPAFVENPTSQILLTFGLSFILVAIGTTVFAFVVYKITRNFGISLTASVSGFYYLIFSTVSPSYNSTWSFINGMESPMSICLFGLFLYLLINKRLLHRPTISAVIFSAVIMTLIIFARLDDAFLLLPYLALIYIFSDSKKETITKLTIATGIPVLATLAYLFHNYSYSGSFLPVSGMIKQGNWLVVNLAFL